MKIGLLFPGQGAQAVGMGQALLDRSEVARSYFDQAAEILGFDLAELCVQGPAEQLNRTEYSQVALFVHSFAALKQLELDRSGLWSDVRALAGLSLGEYTAIVAGGGLSFEAGVRLVRVRGTAMQLAADAVDSGMCSVLGLETSMLEQVCQQASDKTHQVQIANLLCPGNIAISGHITALERAEALAMEAGAFKVVRLAVAGAFHTPLMAPASESLSAALSGADFQSTCCPVFSNVDSKPHVEPNEFRDLLARQITEPVQWEASLSRMIEHGCDHFLEIGSGRVLAGTLKRINRKVACESFGE